MPPRSFNGYLSPCGMCRLMVESKGREAFVKPVKNSELRTVEQTLEHLGEPGFAVEAPPLSRLKGFDLHQGVIVGDLHGQDLGVIKKALKLFIKRQAGGTSSTLSKTAAERVATLEYALLDADRHIRVLQRVTFSLRGTVRFFNSRLSLAMLQVAVFASRELIACGQAGNKQQRVSFCEGLVTFARGMLAARQVPCTPASRAAAHLHLVEGVNRMHAAFPPGGAKGDGKSGMCCILPHGVQHVGMRMGMYGASVNTSDKFVEQDHQKVKTHDTTVNRGNRESWADTFTGKVHDVEALLAAFREGRFGERFLNVMGPAAAAFATEPTSLPGALMWGKFFSNAVEVVEYDERDLRPRPVNANPPRAPLACSALHSWALPSWRAEPPAVMSRHCRAGAVVFEYGVGAVPAQPFTHTPLAADHLSAARMEALLPSLLAAYPGLTGKVETMDLLAFEALKLPGDIIVKKGDWVLGERAQMACFLKLRSGSESSDPVVDFAEQTINPMEAGAEEMEYWPELFSPFRVRDIFAVKHADMWYPLVVPIYYEFKTDDRLAPQKGRLYHYIRDDAPYTAGGSVPTYCWELTRWMGGEGAKEDEVALPASVICMTPNVVHKCGGSCKVRESCEHHIYRDLAPKFLSDLVTRKCRCTEKQKKVLRMTHACGGQTSNTYLLSPFDFDKKAYVKW